MGRRGLQEGMGGARQVSWPNRASPSVCRAREWLADSRAARARRRQRVLSFDIHHDTCTILKKGKVERTEAISSLVAFTEDDTHATVLSLQFAPPDDPKKAKKFEEVVRLEVLNPFDRQIIKELMAHATETGSLEDLEDSFPKQTLHHSVLQLQEKSSFKTSYCVLVKWKLYIYEDWSVAAPEMLWRKRFHADGCPSCWQVQQAHRQLLVPHGRGCGEGREGRPQARAPHIPRADQHPLRGRGVKW